MFPVVGNRCKATLPADPQPGAARLQVAARQDAGVVFPESGRRSGPVVKFIAVGSHHQLVTRVGLPGEQDQAHGICDPPGKSVPFDFQKAVNMDIALREGDDDAVLPEHPFNLEAKGTAYAAQAAFRG